MKKWMCVLLVALIAGGVYWFSIDGAKPHVAESKKADDQQADIDVHSELEGKVAKVVFSEGKWHHHDQASAEFDVSWLNDVDTVHLVADAEVKMAEFEEVLKFCFANPTLNIVFENAKTGDRVATQGRSQEQSEHLNAMQIELAHSMMGQDNKMDSSSFDKFAIVAIGGDVLGVNFGNRHYVHAHTDGRGVEYFKKKLAGKDWSFRLGILKETTFGQFIVGFKVYQEFSDEISPIVSNIFSFSVFSEMRTITITGFNGEESIQTYRELAEGEYEPKKDDFPKNIDVSEIQVIERDLPMTIPYKKNDSVPMIEPMLISIAEDGSIKINNLKKAIDINKLKSDLTILAQQCQASGAKPMIQIDVNADVGQQKVIDVLNVIRDSGINTVTFIDQNIEKDKSKPETPKVLPGAMPVPDNFNSNEKSNVKDTPNLEPMKLHVYEKEPKRDSRVDSKKGRIVINVRGDGTFSQADYKKVMKTPAEIQAYVEKKVADFKKLDPKIVPKIHLRGDEEALFKHSQTVMKASAEAGVNKIVFSVFPFKEKK